MSPKRIQRRRTKGWRMPDGAVYVGRGSKWGNPYKVLTVDKYGMHPYGFRVRPEPGVSAYRVIYRTETEAATRACHLYRSHVLDRMDLDLGDLCGKDLACWCPLEDGNGNRVPCHADVLLELANGGAE